jgi:hypothetical protein
MSPENSKYERFDCVGGGSKAIHLPHGVAFISHYNRSVNLYAGSWGKGAHWLMSQSAMLL